LNEGGAHHSFQLDATNETASGNGSLEAEKRRELPLATGNKRLIEQIRKILRKHYASKYRVQ
jgi:hypothetical protein